MRWIFFLAFLALAHAETTTEQPFRGITYHRHRDEGRTIHVVTIDLATPGLRFLVTPHAGPRETVRQTTRGFLIVERAQVAVNAHFFEPFPSWDTDAFLIGAAASNGNLYSDFETPRQNYAILKDAPALNIDRENHASIVHRGEAVSWYNAVAGSAQVITGGVKTVPQYRAGELASGTETGRAYSAADSWYDRRTSRTLIGLTRDRQTLVLCVVDRTAALPGLAVGEVADFLIANYGVWDALNLDGGGSSSLVLENPATHEARMVNSPGEGEMSRAVGSSLAVFAPALR